MTIKPPKPLSGMTENGARWAYRLMEREAYGEQLPLVSKDAWREVLGYAKNVDARAAFKAHMAQNQEATR
jgi:hypothetical protein